MKPQTTMLRDIKAEPLTEEEKKKPARSMHPDCAHFEEPKGGARVEQCSQCGQDIWVSPNYPEHAQRWCGWCALPHMQGEDRQQLLQLLTKGYQVH